MKKRKPIPVSLKQKTMYESLYCCAICQERGSHIHHIDKDNSNNESNNLVLLCQYHHDEAHTTRELSQNLTPDRIRYSRNRWVEQVRGNRQKISTSSGQTTLREDSLFGSASWGYINHSRLIQTIRKDLISETNPDLFMRLRRSSIIDNQGILIKPKNFYITGSYLRNTIYDWYNFADRFALHMYFSELVDRLSEEVYPIHIDERNWNKTSLKNMLNPGNFLFLNKGQYFKKLLKVSKILK